jgi:outer membrane receptor protein involved in Fe transport
MLNEPLADGLAVRLAADWRDSKTGSHLSDPSRPAFDLNRDQTRLLRFKIKANPPALPGMSLGLTATHARSAMPQIEGLRTPFGDRRDPSATYGFFRTLTNSSTARADMEVAKGIGIEALATVGQAQVKRLAPTGFGIVHSRVRDASAELVLRRRTVDQLDFTVGAAVSGQRLEQDIDLSLVLGRGDFSDKQESVGLFGEVELDLTPRLTATTGIRYQWDRQERQGTLDGVRGRESLDYVGTSDFVLPRFALAYAWSPRLSTGFTVLRASNPGGTTISIGGPLQFRPETLWNAELFARAKLDGDRLRLSSNLFITRFRDTQRSVNRLFRPPFGRTVTFADVVNVPRARSRGLEVSLDWALHPTFDLQLSGAMLRTRLELRLGQPFGREFQRAPDWSTRASFEWRPAGALRVSAHARGRDGYFSDDLNTPGLRIDSGWIFETSLLPRTHVKVGLAWK